MGRRFRPRRPRLAVMARRLAALALTTALVAGVIMASAGPMSGSPSQAVLPPVRPWDLPSIRHQVAATAPVRVTATAAILVDGRSGQVLYGRNPHLIWPPASTTKIMTALVAVESTPLSTLITISPQVARFRDGSVVGLPEGARIS